MTVPKGFAQCDRCEGFGVVCKIADCGAPDDVCWDCSGSGLVPTEKLRHAVAGCLRSLDLAAYPKERYYGQADAVLRKVAEHIGERR